MTFFKTIALALTFAATTAMAGDITVNISGVRADQGGTIHILAFNDETAFNENMFAKMVGYVKIPANADGVSGVLKSQNEGEIALMLLHDANENGELDMKGVVPLEGWAYSNGAGSESIPTFQDAAFAFDGADADLNLEMLYAN